MITIFQAIILGATQGITELFPISSLGHSIIIPNLLGWSISQSSNYFLTFLVATHLATSLVLFAVFFKDWKRIFRGLWRSLKHMGIPAGDIHAKLGWMLILGTIPAGILGLVFQKKIQSIFGNPWYVAFFLVINGIILLITEHFLFIREKNNTRSLGESDVRIVKLSWIKTFGIGCAQALALIPGFSRTGVTISASVQSGLGREDAARFAFLLATPIIFLASVYKLPSLIHVDHKLLLPIIIGALVAGLSAYFAVTFLTKYFKTKTLRPFAYYCILIGIVLMIIFAIK